MQKARILLAGWLAAIWLLAGAAQVPASAPAGGVPAAAAPPRALSLTPAQRAWLAAHPVLRVAMDAGRAPVEWRGEDGVQRGISVDFLQRMEAMLGVRFEIVPSKSVADQLARVQRREVDIVSAITQSPERSIYMSVTGSMMSTPIVIFNRVGSPPPGGLGGLVGKRVGVSARTRVAELLKIHWPAIVTVPTDNFSQATQLLRSGQIDAFVGPLLTGTHQLVEQGATDIRVAGETDFRYDIGYGVRKDWPELLSILDLALSAIPGTERDAIRQKWSTVQFTHETDYRPLGALLAAVLVAVVFIVQLRVMVKRRTAELQREVSMRRAREDEIQLLNAALELRVEQRTEQLSLANEELRLAADQLLQTEKVASLGRLVAGIAHELNTPLGSTLTAATSLRDLVRDFGQALASGGLRRSQADAFVQQCAQACGIIERNAYRASALIDNFKEIAVDQASVRRRRFGLAHIAREVIATHHNAWKNTQHRVELDIAEDIELDSFPGPLAQVLSNLLENTLLHGFAGHPGGVVHIDATVQGERVLLTYADNGAGIPAAFRNKVYDPFFTTRMGQGGSGLGLYIVQNLVTGLLGGGIALHSEEGQGTRFDLSLPLVAPVPTDRTASAAHGIVALPAETRG
ncbi:transporter substrate-binding domain-containing protein [Pseudoduganella sp. LjRoot289]|uniref:ATP-binding protein n=1 Tax=Pseudoduganella sp. LjRoot289 TaxID=3342314 RepID=UPI003ECFEB49